MIYLKSFLAGVVAAIVTSALWIVVSFVIPLFGLDPCWRVDWFRGWFRLDRSPWPARADSSMNVEGTQDLDLAVVGPYALAPAVPTTARFCATAAARRGMRCEN